jgi:CHAT domain-containing protein
MSTATVPIETCDSPLAKLAKLATQKQRREWLARNRSLVSLELILEIADQARHLLRVDARRSLALSEIAFQAARLLRDPLAVAHAVRIKANANYALGRHRPALRFYKQAIRSFELLGQTTELGRTLSVSILSLTLCGEYDAAFDAAKRAKAIFVEQQDELRLARLDINLGSIYYRQDRFAEALDCYRTAYPIVLGHHDSEAISVVLSNLAVCLISVGDFSQALSTYKEARESCRKCEMPRLVAQADYNIAYLYYSRGEYSRAIDLLLSARVACETVGDHYHHALCNLDLSELYLELNLSSEAAELARAAHAEFESQGLGYEAAKALAFEAIALGQQTRWNQSLELFRQARSSFVREKNRVWPSLIDLYQALVLFNAERHSQARRLAQSALEFFDSSLLPGKAVLCQLLLARIAQANGDRQKARTDCEAALNKLKEVESPMLEHQAFLLMGQIHSAFGNQRQAYSCLRASRSALETLRTNVRGEELKLSFLKNRLEVYELLVDECLRNRAEGSLRAAFAYIEEAKSRILIDRMLHSHPIVASGGTQGELLRRISDLRDELNGYYRLMELEQLRPGRSQQYLQSLETQITARQNELMRALRECGSTEGTRAHSPESQNVPLEELREALAEDTVVVEYFQIGDRILACLITHRSLEITDVTLASRVETALGLLRFQLTKFRLGSGYTNVFSDSLIQSVQSHLKTLYDELLAPIRGRLDAPHLLIVPHRALHYVPFHALFDGERYVIDDHTVSYAPSLGVYSVAAKKAVNSSGPTLLLGIPDERAPLIEHEIRSLASIWPRSKSYLGAEATDFVLKTEGLESRIVHIATHGYFRQDSPLFSSIRLGNSFLSLYDLYQLRLPAELVTLSGCATGMNVVAAGDELIGLARGLFQAGAQSLLLTLWDAHDASTAEFMQAFYIRLRQGLTKAAALKEAMLEIRERRPHPYQWAPFVLMGGYDSMANGLIHPRSRDMHSSKNRFCHTT